MFIKPCENCGKMYKAKRITSKYCCDTCRRQANRGSFPETVCTVCGKKFKGRRGRRYCSKECANAYQYFSKTKEGRKMYKLIEIINDESIIISGKYSRFTFCIDCNKTIIITCQQKRCKSCSIKELEIRRGRIYKAWADKVKARDGKCMVCGSKNNLEAHHILPKMEYPEYSRDLDNGITLCSECHRTGENAVHKNSAYKSLLTIL